MELKVLRTTAVSVTITNKATVIAGTAVAAIEAILTGAGTATIENDGTVTGTIIVDTTGTGASTIRNYGTLNGTVTVTSNADGYK